MRDGGDGVENDGKYPNYEMEPKLAKVKIMMQLIMMEMSKLRNGMVEAS